MKALRIMILGVAVVFFGLCAAYLASVMPTWLNLHGVPPFNVFGDMSAWPHPTGPQATQIHRAFAIEWYLFDPALSAAAAVASRAFSALLGVRPRYPALVGGLVPTLLAFLTGGLWSGLLSSLLVLCVALYRRDTLSPRHRPAGVVSHG